MSWRQIKPNQEAVVLEFGRYTGTVTNPGCQWINCFGTEVRIVSTAVQSVDLHRQKMVDGLANPLNVSAVVVYRVKNSARATLDVLNYNSYLNTQAQTVLKGVVAKYPYQAPTHDAKHPSLQNEGAIIAKELVDVLQQSVEVAGLEILEFKFNELSYAPEIAAAMLKRQQAFALVQARATIVEGAVETAFSAIAAMEEKGLQLSQEGRERMLTSMMTVMVSENDAQPTVSL
jgi:regulator of protease activity HflC (stomatin/prohibitin superfamily)